MRFVLLPALLSLMVAPQPGSAAASEPRSDTAKVELEENVYSYEEANNGAGPMWCRGSTCLVRIGADLFASSLETLPEAQPLNNCRWKLLGRGPQAWEQLGADSSGRTREPCPVAGFPDGRLFLSANPTLKPEARSGPARPEIWQFLAQNPKSSPEIFRPGWSGTPPFTEHSYRSFAADGPNRELILFQDVGYTHSEWAFYDRAGHWSAQGQLKWPWGADYEKPQPIRVCYPTVALRDHAVHFCGVSDIVEPNTQWRAFKQQLTGREWDYDFRRLFYAWTPDIRAGKFSEWIEISSCEKTCGWITPCDLWVAPDGAAHLLWTERAVDERLREKFFPEAKQSHSLNYAIVRNGKIVEHRSLLETKEGERRDIPELARFQVTPENRLFVFYYAAGNAASGNRIFEIQPGGAISEPAVVPLKYPLRNFFTATVRAGSPPSRKLELLGQRAKTPLTISYASVLLGD